LAVDIFGVCEATEDPVAQENLRQFTKQGLHGEMRYLENDQLRGNPSALLPGAKSVVVVGISYYRVKKDTPPDQGRIARYAWGRDYHKIFRRTLRQLAEFLEGQFPGHRHRLCVDSAPLLEKVYARRAGLGFYGKNGLLINPQSGSFFLLGEILTTLELQPSQDPGSKAGPGCGTCTRCLDACPTKALLPPEKVGPPGAEYVPRLDARRCISYLTIENRSAIPMEFSRACGNLIMGCDICQEVCPYNLAHARPATHPGFSGLPIAGDAIPLAELLQIEDEEQFLKRFAGSPLMRPKREGMVKNALNAAYNAILAQPEQYRPRLLPLVEKIAASDGNARLREIAGHYLRLLTR
jgi:epoxyqueuosine reductase